MKAYLAGPDVFRADAKAYFWKLREMCNEHGITPLIPLDNEVKKSDKGVPISEQIYWGNIAMIQKADVVIANIVPFRGPSVDPGTAFEIGYARALGKKVYLYTTDHSIYSTRVRIKKRTEFTEVEDFKLIDNLMIVHGSGRIYTTFLETLQSILIDHFKKKAAAA